MTECYLAHLSEDGREERVKTHLENTARMAASFASKFDAEEQGALAGLVHDIGKYSHDFQRHIRGDPKRVDHATAGAAECAKLGQLPAAFAVAGHHGGLPDGGSRTDHVDQATLWGRLNRARKGKLPDCSVWKQDLSLPKADVPAYLRTNLTSRLNYTFFIRMLYSCLVDADFLATERFMSGYDRAAPHIPMEELEKKLDDYIAPWFPPQGELNTLRCAVLQQCRKLGETEEPGLFTLTVPTGGGKTVSSLAFALAHAKKHGLDRIIYVIPYTSIIEQNAGVFRQILGEKAVLEHHSGVLYDLEQEADPDSLRLAKATENWDMPAVVTTAVQFFESLFASRSSKCRKLHNLARSVIIFDEAQMLPVPMLRPCVYAISQLVAHFGATAVLCTATQPALIPVFEEFLPGIKAKELCPASMFTSSVFSRVTFRKTGKKSWDELSAELNEQNQVLCIVNSRKGAQEVFSRLEGEGCFHLSTLMYPAHREQILTEIRCRLKDGQPCRVVSTSLIEAGVDVDFPVVYREEAGLDSVLQAAGRCNREGKRNPEESIVAVFQAETPLPPLFSIPIHAGRETIEKFEAISSKEAVTDYFHRLLELKGRDAQDAAQILSMIETENFPFRRIAERFHMIDSQTRTVYIPLHSGEALVGRLRDGERSQALFRQLGKYSVSIYDAQFRSLNEAGAMELLENGAAVLTDVKLYDPQMGLAPKADSGSAYFV